jgi:hypothetical protein
MFCVQHRKQHQRVGDSSCTDRDTILEERPALSDWMVSLVGVQIFHDIQLLKSVIYIRSSLNFICLSFPFPSSQLCSFSSPATRSLHVSDEDLLLKTEMAHVFKYSAVHPFQRRYGEELTIGLDEFAHAPVPASEQRVRIGCSP